MGYGNDNGHQNEILAAIAASHDIANADDSLSLRWTPPHPVTVTMRDKGDFLGPSYIPTTPLAT